MKKPLISLIALFMLVAQAVPVQAAPQALAGSLTALSGSPQPASTSDKITFTATVFIPPTSVEPPTGSVQFQIDGANSGSPVPLTGRHASLSFASMTAGLHNVYAVYSGDDHYTGSTSALFVECIDRCSSTGTNNQNSIILSNEAHGHLIHRMIVAGYGNKNLYEALVWLKSVTGADQILTQDFLNVLAAAPASSEIFTTHVDQIDYDGAVAVNTDGTLLYVDISGHDYSGNTGSTTVQFPNIPLGTTRFVAANSQSAPLTSWNLSWSYGSGVIIITSTYNLLAIAYDDQYPFVIYLPAQFKK